MVHDFSMSTMILIIIDLNRWSTDQNDHERAGAKEHDNGQDNVG